ncbi:MAG: zinc-binding alcohol dehydrogenase, partial [Halobacteriales archaeon]|nr:zinc-binding alcohol dehydrogenase [Halobacteriales archaeon]
GRYLELGTVTPGSTVEFDVGRLTRKSISVTAMVRYQPWYLKKALDFLADHADTYPFDDLIDAVYPLEEVEAALSASAGREVTRASLDPHPQ